MSDAHDSSLFNIQVVRAPAAVFTPQAVRAALDGIAADAARFRRRRGAGDERAGRALGVARRRAGRPGIDAQLGPRGRGGAAAQHR